VNRPQQSISYLPGLDGLRAIAVLAVVVYHANKDWLPGGFLGVEVFFVISGYLITLLLLNESQQHGKIDFRAFWMRRARRLLPAMWTLLLTVTMYCALFERAELGKLRGDVIAAFIYVFNWFKIWSRASYFDASALDPLRHLWSLAVEEQFYLVWPLLIAAVLKVFQLPLQCMSQLRMPLVSAARRLKLQSNTSLCLVTPFRGSTSCSSELLVALVGSS